MLLEGSPYARLTGADGCSRREGAVLHWLAFQRQGRFPCSVPLVLRARLHIFPMKNKLFLQKRPILALKRNTSEKFTPLWAPNLHFSNEKSMFLMQKRHFFVLGDLGRP